MCEQLDQLLESVWTERVSRSVYGTEQKSKLCMHCRKEGASMVCLNCSTDILSFVLFCDECHGLIHNYRTYTNLFHLPTMTKGNRRQRKRRRRRRRKKGRQKRRKLKNRRREGECEYVQRGRRRSGWFQPFKHTVYSREAVYLTIRNLPQSQWFKREDILLLLILNPGPSEPEHDINSYLEPLVSELNKYWVGASMQFCCGGSECTCILPAGRKVCSFLGHSATLGCSKCAKKISGTVVCMNYSGFDWATWPQRTSESQRRMVAEIQDCNTKTKRNRK